MKHQVFKKTNGYPESKLEIVVTEASEFDATDKAGISFNVEDKNGKLGFSFSKNDLEELIRYLGRYKVYIDNLDVKVKEV